jgi:hypothetical protein
MRWLLVILFPSLYGYIYPVFCRREWAGVKVIVSTIWIIRVVEINQEFPIGE